MTQMRLGEDVLCEILRLQVHELLNASCAESSDAERYENNFWYLRVPPGKMGTSTIHYVGSPSFLRRHS